MLTKWGSTLLHPRKHQSHMANDGERFLILLPVKSWKKEKPIYLSDKFLFPKFPEKTLHSDSHRNSRGNGVKRNEDL